MNVTILKQVMTTQALDAIISFAFQTRLWYAKVMTSAGLLVLEKTRADLLVDGRYIEAVKQAAQNVQVHYNKGDFLQTFFKAKNYQRIGVEKEYMTLNQLASLKKFFPKATFVEISGQQLRAIKTNAEIARITKACKVTLEALASVKKMLQPGVSELTLARHLSAQFKALGASQEAFPTIVVSGPRGALPHGQPTAKKLRAGELVTIDCGALYQGYAADITRTFLVGLARSKKLWAIFEIVKTAQELGIQAIKPGVLTSQIDKICRDYITAQGYGRAFLHATGHGLGIDVHERPRLSSRSSQKLAPGMVVTVEPGIYIPELGGVRREDDVLVTKTGFKVLSANGSFLEPKRTEN